MPREILGGDAEHALGGGACVLQDAGGQPDEHRDVAGIAGDETVACLALCKGGLNAASLGHVAQHAVVLAFAGEFALFHARCEGAEGDGAVLAPYGEIGAREEALALKAFPEALEL